MHWLDMLELKQEDEYKHKLFKTCLTYVFPESADRSIGFYLEGIMILSSRVFSLMNFENAQ